MHLDSLLLNRRARPLSGIANALIYALRKGVNKGGVPAYPLSARSNVPTGISWSVRGPIPSIKRKLATPFCPPRKPAA